MAKQNKTKSPFPVFNSTSHVYESTNYICLTAKQYTSKKMQESSSLSAALATLGLSKSGTMNLTTNESK